jgi:hypothetical protein
MALLKLIILQVVLCGLVEMIIQEAQGISLGISVLRSLRLLRIFKVTR